MHWLFLEIDCDLIFLNDFLLLLFGLFLFLLRHLFHIASLRLKRYSIDCTTSCAFDHVAGAIRIANFGLAITTNKQTIQRIAFVHVVTATANIKLGISRYTLLISAEITAYFPKSIFSIHFRELRDFFSWSRILHLEIATIHLDPIRIWVCTVPEIMKASTWGTCREPEIAVAHSASFECSKFEVETSFEIQFFRVFLTSFQF